MKKRKIDCIEIQFNFELSPYDDCNAFMYHVGLFSFQTIHKEKNLNT